MWTTSQQFIGLSFIKRITHIKKTSAFRLSVQVPHACFFNFLCEAVFSLLSNAFDIYCHYSILTNLLPFYQTSCFQLHGLWDLKKFEESYIIIVLYNFYVFDFKSC